MGTGVVGKFAAANLAVRTRARNVERRGRGGDLNDHFLQTAVRCGALASYSVLESWARDVRIVS